MAPYNEAYNYEKKMKITINVACISTFTEDRHYQVYFETFFNLETTVYSKELQKNY